MANRWKLQNGQYVHNWDHPDLIDTQEPNGPATRIMTALLDRINAGGPSQLTQEEIDEMDRLKAINYGY